MSIERKWTKNVMCQDHLIYFWLFIEGGMTLGKNSFFLPQIVIFFIIFLDFINISVFNVNQGFK